MLWLALVAHHHLFALSMMFFSFFPSILFTLSQPAQFVASDVM